MLDAGEGTGWRAATSTRRGLVGGALGAAALGLLPGAAGAQQRPAAEAGQVPFREMPPQQPVLTIEAGMHVAPIRGIAVDRRGELVATGGTDRSIRIWDAATGELVHRLYPPLAEGTAGEVDAVAMTPDGRYVLAACVDYAFPVPSPPGVMLRFDLTTGQVRVLRDQASRGRGARFHDLTVSTEGNRFAVAADREGVHVLDMASGEAVYRDRFDPSGRRAPAVAVCLSDDGSLLATGDAEGGVRLVQLPLRGAAPRLLPATPALPRGTRPGSLALSPDLAWLAVGDAEAPVVHILDLQLRGAWRRLGLPGGLRVGGNLAAVAWNTPEGERDAWLFAAGSTQDAAGSNVVLAWHDMRRAPISLGVSTDSIARLAPHPRGGVVFASAEPAWGHVEPVRRRGRPPVLALSTVRRGERLDFRETARRLWGVSADGAIVEFLGTKRAGTSPLRFDAAALTLEAVHFPRPDLHRPTQLAAMPRVAVNARGAELLARGERVHSTDRTPEGLLLAGTDDHLLLVDAGGREVARQRIRTPAWAVAAAQGNRQVAVAAHGDGALRWYTLPGPSAEAPPLTELGGVFVHADLRRWVAWTSDGRFAHSDLGGQTLLGYVQNGQPRALAGRWINLGQLYRQRHAPEAIRNRLGGVPIPGERPAEATPDEVLRVPQVIPISVCPAETSAGRGRSRALGDVARDEAQEDEPFTAAYGTSPAAIGSGGAGCLFIDPRTRGISAQGGNARARGPGIDASASREIVLPPGTRAARIVLELRDAPQAAALDSMVDGRNAGRMQLSAEGARRIETAVELGDGEHRVTFRAVLPDGRFGESEPLLLRVALARVPAQPAQRALHVLAAGVDRYRGRITPLRLAVADARTFVNTIGAVAPPEFARPEAVLLEDEAADTGALRATLARLVQTARPGDAVLIYLAGHGVLLPGGGYAYVTSDVLDVAALRGPEGTAPGLRTAGLVEALSELRATRAMLLLDTCHAGGFDAVGPGAIANESGRLILGASATLDEALDSYNGVNGVFAHAVMEGLTGRAGGDAGLVDALHLGAFVRRRVPELAKEKRHQQAAIFRASGDIAAFPLARQR